jgi:hypothetical protein
MFLALLHLLVFFFQVDAQNASVDSKKLARLAAESIERRSQLCKGACGLLRKFNSLRIHSLILREPLDNLFSYCSACRVLF